MAIYRPDIDALERQIASILTQSGCLVRLHLFTDGLMEQLPDIRQIASSNLNISLHEFPRNQGPASCFLAGLAHALEAELDAHFFAFADQDDIWLPQKLAASVSTLELAEADAVHCDAAVVNQNGELLAPSIFSLEGRLATPSLAQLFFRNNATGMTMLLRRETASKIVSLAHLRPKGWLHDHFAAFIAMAGSGLAFRDEVLVRYIQHGGNAVGAGRPNRLATPSGRFLDAESPPASLVSQGVRLLRQMRDEGVSNPGSADELARLIELLERPGPAGAWLLAKALIRGLHMPRSLAARLLVLKFVPSGQAA